jgi:molybdenum cofactor cytidylyltransferase
MFRSFAIVPAAGRSARMGAPKLLLPLAGRAVIDHVLAAWTTSAVTRTVVVVRADDAELLARCRQFDVDVITPPSPPPDMKASVQHALTHIAAAYQPAERDAWLLAPADQPRLSARIVDQLLQAYDPASPIAIAPTWRGERGHPTLLPWSTARDVHQLAPEDGVNSLVERLQVRDIDCGTPTVLDDLDNLADYDRLAANAAGLGEETPPA